ncbi:hypothetical protein LTR53_015913 [Teratosphaeriaceae sp. CCFEE 6253]|nr:hypothetical protein LTR53_015913 [Teratosphaeriaceae sp. CCFEE 6253]
MGSMGTEAQIPVIDIRASNPDAPRQLLDAATRYGFVFIENKDTGVDVADINFMFDLSRQFFASPIEVKEEVSINSNKAGKNHGWLSQGVEKLDPATQKRPDVKEYVPNSSINPPVPVDHIARAFNMGEPVHGAFQQALPAPLKPHAQTLLAFQARCLALCHQILRLVARALDIDEHWFTVRHSQPGNPAPSSTVFRMLYYPHLANPDSGLDLRAGAHSDFGSLTLLFQQLGQPGLEIKTPSGDWAAVPVDPHESSSESHALPILVNIGDLLEDWTGGLLRSTVHRVIFSPPTDGDGDGGGDRYSMAYFCQPLDEALLEPVPSRLVQEHICRTGGRSGARGGKVITARDHLMERLAATYTVK